MSKVIYIKHSTAGFTMIEIIVIVLLIGVMSAIAIPSWLQFITRQRLNQAQDRGVLVLRDAQAKAKQSHSTWQACLRDNGTRVDSAVTTDCSVSANWQPLISSNDSQLLTITTTNLALSPGGYYAIQYQADGTVDQSVNPISSPPPELIFAIRNQSAGSKTCISVQTLLGAIHTDKDTGC